MGGGRAGVGAGAREEVRSEKGGESEAKRRVHW